MRLLSALHDLTIKMTRIRPVFPLVPGGWFSPLDTAAERVGLDSVEALFRESRLARAIARAYVRYLDDPEAERALKKGYHVTYEQRLRTLALAADPPEAYGFASVPLPNGSYPLDAYAWRDLQRVDQAKRLSVAPRLSLSLSLLHWLSAVSEGFNFLLQAFILLPLYGVKRVKPRSCLVAAPNFWPEERWILVKDALQGLSRWSDDTLLLVMERNDNQALRHGQFPTLDPATLPIPRQAWLRRVLFPACRMVFTLLMLSILAWRDARTLELIAECFRQGSGSLEMWRIVLNIQCKSYLDVAEYSSAHTIKAILLRKFGGRLVRWPHSQLDTPGCALSFVGYDVFLSAGPYQAQTYGHSWYPRTQSISVGHFQNDRRFKSSRKVFTDYMRQIEEQLINGKSLAVFFGASEGQGLKTISQNILDAVRQTLEGCKDWFVVLKPKGTYQGFYEEMKKNPRLSDWFSDPNLICVRYTTPGVEVCPTGWLIERMKFGVGIGGSVQSESLTQGAPFFAYRPVWQMTPYKQKLLQCGLLHDNIESLKMALRQFIQNPNGHHIPYEWFCEAFDPFGDDQTLTRIASVLLGGREYSPEAKGSASLAAEGSKFREWSRR